MNEESRKGILDIESAALIVPEESESSKERFIKNFLKYSYISPIEYSYERKGYYMSISQPLPILEGARLERSLLIKQYNGDTKLILELDIKRSKSNLHRLYKPHEELSKKVEELFERCHNCEKPFCITIDCREELISYMAMTTNWGTALSCLENEPEKVLDIILKKLFERLDRSEKRREF